MLPNTISRSYLVINGSANGHRTVPFTNNVYVGHDNRLAEKFESLIIKKYNIIILSIFEMSIPLL